MRARVPLTARSRLVRLERVSAPDRRGGVLLLPPILGLDEWEALAVPSQHALAMAGREDDVDINAPEQDPRRNLQAGY